MLKNFFLNKSNDSKVTYKYNSSSTEFAVFLLCRQFLNTSLKAFRNSEPLQM